jgi:hypothetical protein
MGGFEEWWEFCCDTKNLSEGVRHSEHPNKYDLYVSVRLPPSRTAILSLDDNKFSRIRSISDVQTTLRNALAARAARICVSSTEVEKLTEGLSRHGADIMVLSGLGTKQYDVATGTWSRDKDIVFKVPLPSLVIVCMK